MLSKSNGRTEESSEETQVTAHMLMVEALGGKCETCGISENLVIHHRDQNRYNNARNNLVVLCTTHHQNYHNQHKSVNGKTPFEEPTIHVNFSRSEFQRLVFARGNKDWHDFILSLLEPLGSTDRRRDKKMASDYSKRGHEAERVTWEQVIPALFSGTNAKIIRVGGIGKEDGIIDYNGLMFVCHSSDYCLPLDRTYGYIRREKLTACFNRCRIENERGNANTNIAIIFHEVNRNGWIVRLITNPLSIPVDPRGRPIGSEKIDLRILKPNLTLEDFAPKHIQA